uniref:Uncharacterized protein n=1 Tax=Spongospora subterranea TaxID=70186 RepID=A0A0H5QYC9_9EUKA|eukprot:CRZ06732.1 hypothetical protein [Spongospora subterranea]
MDSLNDKIELVEADLSAAKADLADAKRNNNDNLTIAYVNLVSSLVQQLAALQSRLPPAAVEINEPLTVLWKQLHEGPDTTSSTSILNCLPGSLLLSLTTPLFVRQSYVDISALILEHISTSTLATRFALSGSPGVGKSCFFFFLLFSISRRSTSSKFRVLYQLKSEFHLFSPDAPVLDINPENVSKLLQQSDIIYIVDGLDHNSPRVSWCHTIFISSARNEEYLSWCKQNRPRTYMFPVWSMSEVLVCRQYCYPDLDISVIEHRFRLLGGNARYIFGRDDYLFHLNAALQSANATLALKSAGSSRTDYPIAQMLFHAIVGDYDPKSSAPDDDDRSCWDHPISVCFRRFCITLCLRPTGGKAFFRNRGEPSGFDWRRWFKRHF